MFPVTVTRSLSLDRRLGGAGAVVESRRGGCRTRELACLQGGTGLVRVLVERTCGWCSRPSSAVGQGSVLVRQRPGDVQSREQDEDVGLQELDEDLEDRH